MYAGVSKLEKGEQFLKILETYEKNLQRNYSSRLKLIGRADLFQHFGKFTTNRTKQLSRHQTAKKFPRQVGPSLSQTNEQHTNTHENGRAPPHHQHGAARHDSGTRHGASSHLPIFLFVGWHPIPLVYSAPSFFLAPRIVSPWCDGPAI